MNRGNNNSNFGDNRGNKQENRGRTNSTSTSGEYTPSPNLPLPPRNTSIYSSSAPSIFPTQVPQPSQKKPGHNTNRSLPQLPHSAKVPRQNNNNNANNRLSVSVRNNNSNINPYNELKIAVLEVAQFYMRCFHSDGNTAVNKLENRGGISRINAPMVEALHQKMLSLMGRNEWNDFIVKGKSLDENKMLVGRMMRGIIELFQIPDGVVLERKIELTLAASIAGAILSKFQAEKDKRFKHGRPTNVHQKTNYLIEIIELLSKPNTNVLQEISKSTGVILKNDKEEILFLQNATYDSLSAEFKVKHSNAQLHTNIISCFIAFSAVINKITKLSSAEQYSGGFSFTFNALQETLSVIQDFEKRCNTFSWNTLLKNSKNFELEDIFTSTPASLISFLCKEQNTSAVRVRIAFEKMRIFCKITETIFLNAMLAIAFDEKKETDYKKQTENFENSNTSIKQSIKVAFDESVKEDYPELKEMLSKLDNQFATIIKASNDFLIQLAEFKCGNIAREFLKQKDEEYNEAIFNFYQLIVELSTRPEWSYNFGFLSSGKITKLEALEDSRGKRSADSERQAVKMQKYQIFYDALSSREQDFVSHAIGINSKIKNLVEAEDQAPKYFLKEALDYFKMFLNKNKNEKSIEEISVCMDVLKKSTSEKLSHEACDIADQIYKLQKICDASVSTNFKNNLEELISNLENLVIDAICLAKPKKLENIEKPDNLQPLIKGSTSSVIPKKEKNNFRNYANQSNSFIKELDLKILNKNNGNIQDDQQNAIIDPSNDNFVPRNNVIKKYNHDELMGKYNEIQYIFCALEEIRRDYIANVFIVEKGQARRHLTKEFFAKKTEELYNKFNELYKHVAWDILVQHPEFFSPVFSNIAKSHQTIGFFIVTQKQERQAKTQEDQVYFQERKLQEFLSGIAGQLNFSKPYNPNVSGDDKKIENVIKNFKDQSEKIKLYKKENEWKDIFNTFCKYHFNVDFYSTLTTEVKKGNVLYEEFFLLIKRLALGVARFEDSINKIKINYSSYQSEVLMKIPRQEIVKDVKNCIDEKLAQAQAIIDELKLLIVHGVYLSEQPWIQNSSLSLKDMLPKANVINSNRVLPLPPSDLEITVKKVALPASPTKSLMRSPHPKRKSQSVEIEEQNEPVEENTIKSTVSNNASLSFQDRLALFNNNNNGGASKGPPKYN